MLGAGDFQRPGRRKWSSPSKKAGREPGLLRRGWSWTTGRSRLSPTGKPSH